MAVAGNYTKVGFVEKALPTINGANLQTVETGVLQGAQMTGLESDRTTALATANPFALLWCSDSQILYLSLGASGWQFLFARPVAITSLPTSPVDGQEIDYVADAANGVRWRFRYNAGSSSTYKWEFVGGAALYNGVNALQATSSLTYTDLTTVGPQLTCPFAGDYDVDHGANYTNNTASDGARMSLSIGGAAVADSDGIALINGSGGAGSFYSDAMSIRKTGLAAATTLVEKYRALTGGSASFSARWLKLTPVRIG